MYDYRYRRRMLELDGSYSRHLLSDHAFALYRRHHPNGPPPRAFVNARELTPAAHLDMQAALQPYVDNSISKTINVPREYDFGAFKDIYELACARPERLHHLPSRSDHRFSSRGRHDRATDSRCCNVEREAD